MHAVIDAAVAVERRCCPWPAVDHEPPEPSSASGIGAIADALGV